MTDVSRRRSYFLVACGFGAAAGIAHLLRQRHRRRKTQVRIKGLYVYPVKSCRGVSLKKAELTSEGLLHDRRYVLIDVSKKVVLTGREAPQMQLIVPEMPTNLGMVVSKEGMASLKVPSCGTGVIHKVDMIFTGDADVEDMGDEAAAWFREALGQENVRLCRVVGERQADPQYGTGFLTGSDGFSVLVTSEESLAKLADKSGLGFVAERMRPNLVVAGCPAHDEDRWSSLHWTQRDASAELVLVKPCARCKMPSVDPAKGVFGPDPLKALTSYRSGKILMEADLCHGPHYASNKGDIFFGQNANTLVVGRPMLEVGGALSVVMSSGLVDGRLKFA
eukprot:gnl/MRDRNA2_/MRDRNA2_139225_c0_seq1.p1 gnl/MRDRNA2_/MRDRNA2_139225_c0~~gnl/MRDRNA2_/MRDRNA2_139225_c0_seq1.p1  ORF type:complete len:335 (-),score=68.91 gnl/MRDRNA2_/MRDRNA2_139225_c0_seq1:110-1114(-)